MSDKEEKPKTEEAKPEAEVAEEKPKKEEAEPKKEEAEAEDAKPSEKAEEKAEKKKESKKSSKKDDKKKEDKKKDKDVKKEEKSEEAAAAADKEEEKAAPAPEYEVIVHAMPNALHAPSASPFTMKLFLFLRVADIKYKVDTAKAQWHGPRKGKMPWIEIPATGKTYEDTQHIVEYFRKRKENPVNIEEALSERDLAIARAFREMIESHYYFTHTATLFNGEHNDFVKQMWGITGAIGKLRAGQDIKKHRNNAIAQGMGRHNSEEITRFARQDLQAVSQFLGEENEYLMGGEKPGVVDCALFGHLVQTLYHSPTADSKAKSFLQKKCKNLVSFVERIREKYFPDWNELCVTPIPTTAEQAVIDAKREADEKEAKEKAEQEAKEKAEQEAKEKAEKEAAEKEAAEKAEKEAAEKAEKEKAAKEKKAAEKAAKAKEKEEKKAKEKKAKEEKAKEKEEKEEPKEKEAEKEEPKKEEAEEKPKKEEEKPKKEEEKPKKEEEKPKAEEAKKEEKPKKEEAKKEEPKKEEEKPKEKAAEEEPKKEKPKAVEEAGESKEEAAASA